LTFERRRNNFLVDMSYSKERQEIVMYGRLLYDRGYLAGKDGNLSIKLSDGTILITPSGVAKGFLDEVDMAVVDADGKQISSNRKASSESLMHLYVYKMRPEINACCHAHPPYSTAFSIVGKSLPSNILPEVVLTVGEVPITEYASPGTDEVPRSLDKYISDHSAFILRNHGVLTIGRTAEEAYHRMETVEHYAKIIYIAENMGEMKCLDPDQIGRLLRNSQKSGKD